MRTGVVLDPVRTIDRPKIFHGVTVLWYDSIATGGVVVYRSVFVGRVCALRIILVRIVVVIVDDDIIIVQMPSNVINHHLLPKRHRCFHRTIRFIIVIFI